MSRTPLPAPAPPGKASKSNATRARELYDGLTSWPHREPTFVAAVVAVLLLLAIVAISMI